MIKREIRVVGVDDAPFKLKEDKMCMVVGVVTRGREYIDGVLSTTIEVDGKDGTEKIANMIKYSKFWEQLKAVFLDGISYAGFNIVDIKRLYEEVRIPIIVIIKNKPNKNEFIKALKRISNPEERLKAVKNAGDINEITTIKGKIFFQYYGCSESAAKELITKSIKRASIPECLRIAHLVASGIVKGESGRGV